MIREEFYNWFHTKYLPHVQKHTGGDMRYYRDMVVETLAFLTEIGNCYTYLNYACILAAWANEHFIPSLPKFVASLEASKVNYWEYHEDEAGLLPSED